MFQACGGHVRRFLTVVLAVLIGFASAAVAEDSRLQRLDSRETSRGWDAVGRLEIGGRGFCTAALIAPDLVVTAAHCLFDKNSGRRLDHGEIEFLAGWRNGRAEAYRDIRRAVIHPDYVFEVAPSAERVRTDVALIELQHPIRNTTIFPFATGKAPRTGEDIGVVSYAFDRADAPSIQSMCGVLGVAEGVVVTSCSVDFGSSGAPIFSFAGGQARIVSLVSAKAQLDNRPVALGASLGSSLQLLRAELDAGGGYHVEQTTPVSTSASVSSRNRIGAKFVRANGG